MLFSADGTQLNFVTQTNGNEVEVTNLSAAVSWSSNDWHQVVLTFGPTNSALYLDGQAVITNGMGVGNFPDATALANGFFIGSDNSGNNQARGQFDDLEILIANPVRIGSRMTIRTIRSCCHPSKRSRSARRATLGRRFACGCSAGGMPLNYQWYFNGSPLANATNATLAFAVVQMNNAGNYSVVVANSLGSVTSSNALLTVLTPLTVSITSPTKPYARYWQPGRHIIDSRCQ